MFTSTHRLIRNTSVLPVSARQQCPDCRWFLQHCETMDPWIQKLLQRIALNLLDRLTWETLPFGCILEPFHPPSPCTSSASDRKTGLSEQQETPKDKMEWMAGRIRQTFWRVPALFTSYSLTISGTWSFSSSFCCLFSNLSMQWWQQRIFSSSFSSSMEVTLLRLLMLPLLGPIPLLLPPDVTDWEWTGLPAMQRASRVPLISFSVNRPKAYDLTALWF